MLVHSMETPDDSYRPVFRGDGGGRVCRVYRSPALGVQLSYRAGAEKR